VSHLIWSPRALDDLDMIRDHIARDSAAYAELVLIRLLVAPERLVRFPESGRMVPEFGLPNLREIIVSPFRIVYRLRGDVVEVVTVFHSARVLPAFQS
jgi:toxin ParE1/3/4